MVLVDGLDEVPEAQRKSVYTWLSDLVSTYPKTCYLITFRHHAIDRAWFDRNSFDMAELQPMELQNIYTFIDYWHNAIAENLQNKDREDRA